MFYKKLFNKKNNEEAKKFYLYTLYKKKVLAFDALKNYAIFIKILNFEVHFLLLLQNEKNITMFFGLFPLRYLCTDQRNFDY